MKPRNFPGNKNRRRIVAIKTAIGKEKERLSVLITDDETAGAIRSKKHREGKRKS